MLYKTEWRLCYPHTERHALIIEVRDNCTDLLVHLCGMLVEAL